MRLTKRGLQNHMLNLTSYKRALRALGRSPDRCNFRPGVKDLNKHGRGPVDDATYQMTKTW